MFKKIKQFYRNYVVVGDVVGDDEPGHVTIVTTKNRMRFQAVLVSADDYDRAIDVLTAERRIQFPDYEYDEEGSDSWEQ